MPTACLTKVKAKEQRYDTSNKANESNEIEFSKLFSNWTPLVWIEIEEHKENNCRNAASGSGDDHEYSE